MGGFTLVNLEALAEPATKLIEKVSDALGWVAAPYQITRMSKAEVKADRIRTFAKLDLQDDLEKRALDRMISEEKRNQKNMERILAQSFTMLSEGARPEELNNDWLVNFFEKCRLVSDGDMQDMWARILSQESNQPGSFSKRTVNLLSSLDKDDAVQFTKICAFVWQIDGKSVCLIYNNEHEVYKNFGISFELLTHLDTIGLISFEYLDGFLEEGLAIPSYALYGDKKVRIDVLNKSQDSIETGHVLLTKMGVELSRICGPEVLNDFYDYTLRKWASLGKILSSPLV